MCKTPGNLTKKAQFQTKLIIYCTVLNTGTPHQNTKKKNFKIIFEMLNWQENLYMDSRYWIHKRKKGASSATMVFQTVFSQLKSPGNKKNWHLNKQKSWVQKLVIQNSDDVEVWCALVSWMQRWFRIRSEDKTWKKEINYSDSRVWSFKSFRIRRRIRPKTRQSVRKRRKF